MYCKACEEDFKKSIESAQENIRFFRRMSIKDFHSSITQGCEICNQVWCSIVKSARKYAEREDLPEPEINTEYIPTDLVGFETQIETVRTLYGLSQSRGSQKRPAKSVGRQYNTFGSMVDLLTKISMPSGMDDVSIARMHYTHCEVERDDEECESVCHPKLVAASTAASPHLWRKWLNDCILTHIECGAPSRSALFTPTRLVQIAHDAKNSSIIFWRVVPFEGLHRPYLTLSHCWGNSDHLKLTRANILSLCGSWHSLDELPRVYRDALYVVDSLEYEFIWIDSLCIIQDDIQDWREQSSLMGQIYSHSVCNVAAASAEDGDRGCFRSRNPFITSSDTITCADNSGTTKQYKIMNREHTLKYQLHDLPLYERAWVLQERVLCPRQLVFGRGKVFWECNCALACEELPMQTSIIYPFRESYSKAKLDCSSTLEYQRAWKNIIKEYSRCSVSRASDRTVAIAGLAAEYQRKTEDTYLQGLWTVNIHEQLAWIAEERGGSRLRSNEAATWSWLSLNNEVGYTYDMRNYDLVLLRLMDAKIRSRDPMQLHSFEAGYLTIQVVVAQVDLKSLKSRTWRNFKKTRVIEMSIGNYIEVISRLHFGISLDETLNDPLSSELLLIFTGLEVSPIRTWNTRCILVQPSTKAEHKDHQFYERLGVIDFRHRDLRDFLTSRFQLDAQEDSTRKFRELDDPEVADLVKTITLV